MYMLHRTNIFLETKHLKHLAVLGQARGLKTAQTIRLAIADFIRRETARDRAAKAAEK